MGYKRKFGQGDVPGYGAIFMSNTGTKKECFQRKLFGLPLAQSDFVLHVKKGMMLFLFEFEKRQLHGVFRATANGEIDIEPNAFRSSGKCFPAQVPFTSIWNCNPLHEHEFKDAIRDNYFSWKKFKFGLSKDQVYNLMTLFRSKTISKNDPPKTCLRYYDDKPAERDTRFADNRNKVRDRVKSIEEEDDHDFDFDEVDDRRTGMKERAHRDNKEVFFKNCKKERDDFADYGSRKLDKHRGRTLGGFRRVSDASLRFTCDINNGNEMHKNLHEVNGITNLKEVKREHDIEDRHRHIGKISDASIDEKFLVDGITNKRKYFRDNNRIQDEYHVINGLSQNLSAQDNLGSPGRGSQTVVDGWFFCHGTVESQPRPLTDHPLSKPKGITNVFQSPKYEPKTSLFEQRGTDFGIQTGPDEEFDLGNVDPTIHNSLSNSNQNNSGFIPISEASEQFQPPLEFTNIEDTYEHPSMITMHTPYDPEVPDLFHRPSDFAPGPVLTPTDNGPVYPSETILHHSENKGSDFRKPRSKRVRKVCVFDRLNSFPKSFNNEQEHESDEKSELDVTVNKVMKMLEDIVSKQDDDDDNKVVDYELPKRESDVDIKHEGKEGGELILEEKRVVDYKRCKKESTAQGVIRQPLKVESFLENIGVQKSTQNGNVLEKQEQDYCGFAKMVRVKDDGKMCGWIEE